MNFIRILLSVVNLSWHLFQLDVNNVLLYGDLQEEVYMEQSPDYVAQGENKVCYLKRLFMASSRVHMCGLKS